MEHIQCLTLQLVKLFFFHCIGYRTEEVLIRNQEVINIIMAKNSVLMEEVWIVGYGTQKKYPLRSSVSMFQ